MSSFAAPPPARPSPRSTHYTAESRLSVSHRAACRFPRHTFVYVVGRDVKVDNINTHVAFPTVSGRLPRLNTGAAGMPTCLTSRSARSDLKGLSSCSIKGCGGKIGRHSVIMTVHETSIGEHAHVCFLHPEGGDQGSNPHHPILFFYYRAYGFFHRSRGGEGTRRHRLCTAVGEQKTLMMRYYAVKGG